MSYSAEISRTKPGCFLFMVDQSGSMKARISGLNTNEPKQKAAADALNRALQAIAIRCSQGEEVRDYFYIGVIGYSTDRSGNPILDPTLDGATIESPFVPIGDVVNNARVVNRTLKQSDGGGGLVDVEVDFPEWLQPKADHGTPMCAAFKAAHMAIQGWTTERPDSFPPILINISDGEATDGHPLKTAKEIMGITTQDGSPLIFNIHLSERPGNPAFYPTNPDNLPTEHAKKLFEMSSPLHPQAIEIAHSMELMIEPGARGYVFNSDMITLVQFLEIGTRATQNPGAAVQYDNGQPQELR